MSSPHIPGAFDSYTLPPRLDITPVGGTRSHLVQPLSTPSAAAASLVRSASQRSVASTAGKKRTRNESVTEVRHQGVLGGSVYSAEEMGASGLVSPLPLVDTRYMLSGGLDTPRLEASEAAERREERVVRQDEGFRRGWDQGGPVRSPGGFPQTPEMQQEQEQMRIPSAGQDGWSKAVFSAVGGVASKVWQFCRASAFRGFHAGGGAGYNLRPMGGATAMGEDSMWHDLDEKDDVFGRGAITPAQLPPSQRRDRVSTPIPGQFPEDDDYFAVERTPPRAAKRLHTDTGDGELRKNWVMVPPPHSTSTPRTREHTPARSTPVRRSVDSPARRTTLASGRLSASRAGQRPTRMSGRSSAVSNAGSPVLHSARPASFASPRSPSSATAPGVVAAKTASPASIEAQRYAARRKREEREADVSIRKFNQQLQAMIREGREALGSKFEIEDGDEVEDGFEDEGFDGGSVRGG